jgi:hypothetical protein
MRWRNRGIEKRDLNIGQATELRQQKTVPTFILNKF